MGKTGRKNKSYSAEFKITDYLLELEVLEKSILTSYTVG